jgi:hypothetical protein
MAWFMEDAIRMPVPGEIGPPPACIWNRWTEMAGRLRRGTSIGAS